MNVKNLVILLFTLCVCPSLSAQMEKLPSQEEFLQKMRLVADWQLDNPSEKRLNGWEYAPFYMGLLDLYQVTNDEKYLDAILEMGEVVNWEPLPRPYDANSLAITQVFLELFEITGDTFMIDKSRYVLDTYLMRWLKPEVHFKGNKYWYEWWTWCDALFMALPAFARMAKILEEPKYLKKSDELWWLTSDYLYKKTDSLIFRDDRFFEKRSQNGHKIYWSRGNGWVFSGLTRVLNYLPTDHLSRPKYEQKSREMAYKLRALQLANGFWSQSLLDAQEFPQEESSGTAFFIQGTAWGINQGLLPKEDFQEALLKGWQALNASLHADGKLGYVQKVGHEPTEVSYEDTETYGTGAFLLAGKELYKMAIDNK